ncbi:hypothetical protein [Pseudotabrizicola formosa]|uniref:hypothetical protein n=1 Tax=Pseudotabrizicola formosa TaxID=2030009 RepID=UPI000CD07AD5|nr:hypothetical protein [Pseudotabrizicola formosa]
MTQKNAITKSGTTPLSGAELRDARLKAALKANMARRKAQARQRGAAASAVQGDAAQDGTDGGTAAGLSDDVGTQNRMQPGPTAEPQPDAASGDALRPGLWSGTSPRPDTASDT